MEDYSACKKIIVFSTVFFECSVSCGRIAIFNESHCLLSHDVVRRKAVKAHATARGLDGSQLECFIKA